ncbi:MAG: M14 family metallocarboxypeptidase, partial [Cryomorphaceae bacterium]
MVGIKTIATLFALAIVAMCAAQPSPQPRKMTEKFFPDPDIDIPTPAFEKKRGFTSYEEMMEFIESLRSHHPDLISVEFIGESQKGERIPMVVMGGKADTSANPIRIWLQGGLHGNEPAGTEGLLWLMHNLLKVDSLGGILRDMQLAIVPMANIDGSEKNKRYAANGLDLNRDQTKLTAPETWVLKEAYNAFDPEVALDFHEFRPFRRDFTKFSTYGVSSLFDVMFLYSSNLNVPPRLRKYTKDRFVSASAKDMDKQGYSNADYFSTGKHFGEIYFSKGALNARSSATSYALTGAVSTLVEVRGVGLGRTSYKRRVHITYRIAVSFLKTAINHRDELRRELDLSNSTDIEKVALKTIRPPRTDSIDFINVETNEIIPVTAPARDALDAEAKNTRSMPSAYILLPAATAAVDRIRALGIEAEELQSDTSFSVESLLVTSYFQESQKYEGVYKQEVETEVVEKKVNFPKGSLFI